MICPPLDDTAADNGYVGGNEKNSIILNDFSSLFILRKEVHATEKK
jgi:hypothetical protein